jgi:hypothetical protein
MRVLKVLARERSPLAIDIYTWLTWKMSFLRDDSRPVPWEFIHLQFGADYSEGNLHKFKAKFLERLRLVLLHYRGARVDLDDGGLVLRPSPTHVAPRLAQ